MRRCDARTKHVAVSRNGNHDDALQQRVVCDVILRGSHPLDAPRERRLRPINAMTCSGTYVLTPFSVIRIQGLSFGSPPVMTWVWVWVEAMTRVWAGAMTRVWAGAMTSVWAGTMTGV